MRIHVEFTARNMRNSQGRLAAYFSFQDGAALEDFNDRFTTTGGNVSVGRNFSPSYAQSRYDDFTLFMPYDELHMSDGEHQLEFKVIAFHTLGEGYTEYARSSGHRFTYDSAPDHENGEGEFGADSLEAGFTPDPHTVSLRAEGRVSPPGDCAGHITAQADYTLYWSGDSDFLRFYVDSNGEDTVLVISDPYDNIRCDDDSGDGADAAISYNDPETGRYDVWVGTFDDNDSFAAQLKLTELGAPSSSSTPATNEVHLAANFLPDPYTADVRASSSTEAPSDCAGYIPTSSSYVLYWSGESDLLRFDVDSNGEDTVLVISDPYGDIVCNDDYGSSSDATVRFENPETGRYDIYVGTFYSGENFAAELSITELE